MMIQATLFLIVWAFILPMHWPYAAMAGSALWLVWSVREFLTGFRMGIDEFTRGAGMMCSGFSCRVLHCFNRGTLAPCAWAITEDFFRKTSLNEREGRACAR